MKKRSFDLTIIGYGAVILLSLSLFGLLQLLTAALIGVSTSAVYYLMITLVFNALAIIGFIGVLELQEHMRRFLVGISFVAVLYFAAEFYHGNLTMGDVGLPIFYLLVLAYITRSHVALQFEQTFHRVAGSPKTVLVVDDDKALVKTMESVLSSKGFSVLSALTGEKGLEVARNKKPDLIVLDVILPQMKGRDVCIALKKERATKDIPVLFLTAKYSQDDINAEMAAGAVGHLTKPVDSQTLLREIELILGA